MPQLACEFLPLLCGVCWANSFKRGPGPGRICKSAFTGSSPTLNSCASVVGKPLLVLLHNSLRQGQQKPACQMWRHKEDCHIQVFLNIGSPVLHRRHRSFSFLDKSSRVEISQEKLSHYAVKFFPDYVSAGSL